MCGGAQASPDIIGGHSSLACLLLWSSGHMT
jgi:hypothetical protein